MHIDENDRKLLNLLQADSRLTSQQLSEQVPLSPSACHRRIKELERQGVIKGQVTLLNGRKMGLRSVVMVSIRLTSQSQDAFIAFEKAVINLPNLMECHLMAGAFDYQLKILVHDAEEFAELHRESLAKLPNVAQMQSNFSLKTVFTTTRLPIDR